MKFMLTIILGSFLGLNPLVATNLTQSSTNQPNCKISFVRVKQLKQKIALRMLMPSSIEDAATALENEIKSMNLNNEKSPDQRLSECLTTLSSAEIHEKAPQFLVNNFASIVSRVRQSLEQQLNPPKENASKSDISIQMSDNFNENYAHPNLKTTPSHNAQSIGISPKLNAAPEKRKNKTQEVKNNQSKDDNVKYMSEQVVSTRPSPIIGNIDLQDQTTNEQVGLLIPTLFNFDSPVNSSPLGFLLNKREISQIFNEVQFHTANSHYRPCSNRFEPSKTHTILNRIQNDYSRNCQFTNQPVTISDIDKRDNSSLDIISKLLHCFGNSWALMMLLILLAYWFSIRHNFVETKGSWPILSSINPAYSNDNIKVINMSHGKKRAA